MNVRPVIVKGERAGCQAARLLEGVSHRGGAPRPPKTGPPGFGRPWPGSGVRERNTLRSPTAGSGGVRNEELGELLGWFEPAECFTGPVVERVGGGVEVVLAVDGEVGAFGEVLAGQAVGVFVCAVLPGAGGGREGA